MATIEQLHKAMIPLCMAIETLADAIGATSDLYAQSAATKARELVNDAHRHMCKDPDTPSAKIEDKV